MSTFSLIYAYALALLSALVVWFARGLFSAISGCLSDWARARKEMNELEGRLAPPRGGRTTKGAAFGLTLRAH